MTTQEEALKKAMDLLGRAAVHVEDGPPPDANWWKDYFLLTGEHMILTDEGWESGDAKAAYLADDPDWRPLDEVGGA